VRLIPAGLVRVEETGAAGLSLRDVAQRSGVSHMAPYSHSGNRAELLCALAVEGYIALRLVLRSAAEQAASPAVAFLACGEAYVRFAVKRPQLLSLMFGGLIPVQEHTAALQNARGQAFADFAELVQAAQRRGQFRPGVHSCWRWPAGRSRMALRSWPWVVKCSTNSVWRRGRSQRRCWRNW